MKDLKYKEKIIQKGEHNFVRMIPCRPADIISYTPGPKATARRDINVNVRKITSGD
jgi:hypothetical protein